MDAVVTQLPTTCNPDKLTADELKAEVLRMQSEVVLMGDRLHTMNKVAFRQAEIIDALISAHIAGDSVFIASQLQVLADHRAKYIAKNLPNLHATAAKAH